MSCVEIGTWAHYVIILIKVCSKDSAFMNIIKKCNIGNKIEWSTTAIATHRKNEVCTRVISTEVDNSVPLNQSRFLFYDQTIWRLPRKLVKRMSKTIPNMVINTWKLAWNNAKSLSLVLSKTLQNAMKNGLMQCFVNPFPLVANHVHQKVITYQSPQLRNRKYHNFDKSENKTMSQFCNCDNCKII